MNFWKYLLVLLFLPVKAVVADSKLNIQTLSSQRFGSLHLYKQQLPAKGAVLLFSGDGGWTGSMKSLARALTEAGQFVVGVDTPAYRVQLRQDDGDCVYIAGELERLSQSAQKGAGLLQYHKAVLLGYGSGSSLVYAALGQHAPAFQGGVLLGFSPDFHLPKPFCPGDGLRNAVRGKGRARKVEFQPAAHPLSNTIVLLGKEEQAVGSKAEKFFAASPEVVRTPVAASVEKFSPVAAWTEAILQALARFDVAPPEDEPAEDLPPGDVSRLPLIELLPDKKEGEKNDKAEKDYWVIFFSGDGGWATVDKEIGSYLSERGIAVVGVDTLSYFWQPKSPEDASAALEQIIYHYVKKLQKKKVVLIGFSMGADVLPFMISRLPQKARKTIKDVVLLSPSTHTDFEVHISAWIGFDEAEDNMEILPEIERAHLANLLCIYGEDDDDCLCRDSEAQKTLAKTAKVIHLPGDHHFDGDYETVGKIILETVEKTAPPQ
jgi:type IV secretory pathway VirJ component